MGKTADNVFHPPSGSTYPGQKDANPYRSYPPHELRRLLHVVKEDEKLLQIRSALKQWERVYQYPYYPYQKLANMLRCAAMILLSEQVGPAQNLPYYQDAEVPEGYESVLEGMQGQYDNDNNPRFDYTRQGERPLVDVDFFDGGFLAPTDGVFDYQGGVVKTKGDGPDPEGMDSPFPGTGGPIDQYPDAM